MQIAIKRIGNSAGIVLPKPVLAHLRLSAGDVVDLDMQEGRVVLLPAERHPRQGWAEAARALVEAGEDGPAWPEFGNSGDESL